MTHTKEAGSASLKKYHHPIKVEWSTHVPPHVLAITTNRNTFATKKHQSNGTDATPPVHYSFFNLGDHVGDDSKQVTNNRNKLTAYLPINTKIQWLNQVHGNEVAVIDDHQEKAITADAALTNKKHIALAVMTADCLPILITNKLGTEIAAIHAGWRPLAKNIITHTIEKMSEKPSDLIAWLGPCISATHFEVGSEVKDGFVQLNPQFASAFTPSKTAKGKLLANLHAIASMQLKALGVEHIASLPECTFSQANKYYSYRRENKTGRMAAIICLC